ncbi:MAG: hypothetical protein CBE47_03590 [Pelagibacteraceae bacterium TMED287]|nr:MAG: hypothetical protein CBE47_03590 [Pelagibacteraceae bacterium TMED287]
MSEIKIKGQDLNNINQSNFQSVGPYTDPSKTQVKETWQGRYIVNGVETDERFSLGTYTENNREFWEIQTVNPVSRKSQFESKFNKTARIKVINDLPVSDEVLWSVDTFPFVLDADDKTVPLYFYYDKDLHSNEYNTATTGKINLRIELREDGRDNAGIMDNNLFREAFRPFIIDLKLKSNEGGDGEFDGSGAFNYDDLLNISATPNETSYFEYFQDGDDNSIISSNASYTFNMPRRDLEVLVNFRSNPIIKITSRHGDGSIDFNSARLLITNENLEPLAIDTETFNFTNYKEGQPGIVNQENVDTWTATDELDIIRPTEVITVATTANAPDQLFDKFTMVTVDGEIDLPGEISQEIDYNESEVTNRSLMYTQRITVEPRPNYPDGVFQIYANYTSLFYSLRSYNSEANNLPAETHPQYHTRSFRLRTGYGDVRFYDFDSDQYLTFSGVKQSPLYQSTFVQSDPGDGYESGEFFWWIGSGATNEFDSELQVQITNLNPLPSGVDGLEDGEPVSANLQGEQKYISIFESQDSNQTEQIIKTIDALHYIGHRFKQLGTYIKITQAENSANIDIETSPDPANIIRTETLSTAIGTPMYQLNGVELTWVIGHSPGLSELPTVQNIEYWDDDIKDFVTTNNLSEIGMTLDQEGNNNSGTVEPNQVVLNYPTPSSNESNNYYKYININMFSEIILQPFLGVFEIDFSSNSENLGTISFLEQAPEIPQTTIIGLFGNENARETPTHAIDMDTWHDGDTSEVIPIPLDIDINAVDTELETLTTNLGPNFQSRVFEILSNSYFDNYTVIQKGAAVEYLTTTYLNLQITDDNSFSIEPDTTTNETVRDVLTFIEQNNDVPRLPIRITATFIREFTLTINSFPVFNNGNSYPTRFITNWNQAAYDENSSLSAADTWLLDDSILEIPFTDMSDSDELQIPSIPSAFFNGERELKIVQEILDRSGADEGTELFFSGTSDPTVITEEISTFKYTHRVVDMDSSATINLNWVGGF